MAARQFRIIAFLAAVSFTGAYASAAIFDRDDRVLVDRHKISPYSAIGIVYGSKKATFATGFLVSECHVLTVQHVFSEMQSGLGERLKFRGELAGGFLPSRNRSQGTIIASGGFHRNHLAAGGHEGRSRDWILIRLDKCLGATLGFAELVPRTASEMFRGDDSTRDVQSAGVPGDVRRLVIDPSCSIRGGTSREFLHDCAALPGNSGSPIFEKVEPGDRRLRVVGMTTSADHRNEPMPFHFAVSNRATAVSFFLPMFSRAIVRPR